MAPFYSTALAVLTALVIVVHSHSWSVQADCSDYKVNKGCDTGSCVNGGLLTNYSVPATPSPCQFGNCDFFGVFFLQGMKVTVSQGPSASGCCQKCKLSSKCAVWQWIKTQASGACFIYPEVPALECGSKSSNVGSKCNLVGHESHFVSTQGNYYDFNGEPGKSFCLVSDLRLHINMKMTGDLDDRTESSTLLVRGKAVRTWIRELGILWIDEFGKEHSILLVARSGKETESGDGFLELARADGESLPRMQVGEEGMGAGGLTVKFVSIQKKGVYDIDVYSLRIAGLLDMTVQLRVAHPMLRRPDDAETHISLGINRLESTPASHGVIGQTQREGREETTEFSALSSALRKSISADGASGRGFLDGRPEDYVASNVLTADCRYSGYRGRNLPTLAE